MALDAVSHPQTGRGRDRHPTRYVLPGVAPEYLAHRTDFDTIFFCETQVSVPTILVAPYDVFNYVIVEFGIRVQMPALGWHQNLISVW